MKIRRFPLPVLAGAAVLLASAASAQPVDRPKLVVVISVDQFAADLFDGYRPHFTAGLARLSGGTVFHNGYQGQAATETCPGHSTILTGALPARTGIISNSWVDQSVAREDKTVYCAEDETVAGSSSRDYAVSAVHLEVPTLGDLLKGLAPQSRNVAVAGKDRAAVMMSGHKADQRWFWKGDKFVTDLAGAPVPQAVPAVNAAVARMIAAGEPPLVPPALCEGKARPFELSQGFSVGNGHFGAKPGDKEAFRDSPAMDGATLALAAGLVDELKLGRGDATDILSVGLSATDFIGHAYGNGGEEMCLNMLELDREIGDFMATLDRAGLDYAVVLTADHGVEDLPERLKVEGQAQAQRAEGALSAGAVGAEIARQLGLAEQPLSGGISGDIYLRPGLPGSLRQHVINAARRYYAAHPQVQAVLTKAEIASIPLPSGDPSKWTLLQRERASFDPKRSGDLIVVLKPWVTPIVIPSEGVVATHGSAWDYDRRVPILFWRKGMMPNDVARAIDTVDIMPTLAAMIGVPVDQRSIDGRCLAEVEGAACPH